MSVRRFFTSGAARLSNLLSSAILDAAASEYDRTPAPTRSRQPDTLPILRPSNPTITRLPERTSAPTPFGPGRAPGSASIDTIARSTGQDVRSVALRRLPQQGPADGPQGGEHYSRAMLPNGDIDANPPYRGDGNPSTCFSRIQWSHESRDMTVTFLQSGRAYDYPNFPRHRVVQLVADPSPGGFYNAVIKGKAY